LESPFYFCRQLFDDQVPCLIDMETNFCLETFYANRLTLCSSGQSAGVDSACEQKKFEATKLPENE